MHTTLLRSPDTRETASHSTKALLPCWVDTGGDTQAAQRPSSLVAGFLDPSGAFAAIHKPDLMDLDVWERFPWR